jgi:signal transduction histidine kinase/CheY-like chemotaxis protein
LRRETGLVLIVAAAGSAVLPLSALSPDEHSAAWVAVRGVVLVALAASLLLARRDEGVSRLALGLLACGALAIGAGAFLEDASIPLLHVGALAVVAGAVVAASLARRATSARSSDALAELFESLPDAACAIDASGAVVAANRRASTIVDDPGLLSQARSLASQAAGAESLAAVGEIDRKEPAFVAIAAVRASADRRRATLVFRDVTRERTSEQRRLDFLSSVSHELRTPLTSILGFSRLFQDGDLGSLTDDQRDCINRIVTQGQYLLDLLNNLLDLSRLEAGRVKLEPEAVDLASIVRDVATNLGSLSAARGIQVHVDAPESLPHALADRQKIVQVVINLLSNAIKFSSQDGRIEVSVKQTGEELLVCVSDSGIGIPEEEQARLFEKFYQGRAGRTGPVKGTGLGLAIVREIVRLHGGRIWIESKVGQGSKFYFTLACARAAVPAPAPAPPRPRAATPAPAPGAAKRTILVADDRHEILLLLRMKFSKVFHVVEAKNGAEAVDIAMRIAPDLILMDIMMPVMDGTEATRRIKESPATRDIPVYALTAKPTQTEHERMLEMGFAGVFSKPFDPQKLLEEVTRILDRTPRTPPPAAV